MHVQLQFGTLTVTPGAEPLAKEAAWAPAADDTDIPVPTVKDPADWPRDGMVRRDVQGREGEPRSWFNVTGVEAQTISAEAVNHLRVNNPIQIPGPTLTQQFADALNAQLAAQMRPFLSNCAAISA